MSNNEYENGTFVLPGSAVAGLKKVLRDDQNAFHEAVRVEARRLHDSIATTNRSAYAAILDQRRWDVKRGDVGDAAYQVLGVMLWRRTDKTAVVPTVADVERVVPRATAGTTGFPVFDSQGYQVGSIRINGRSLTWHVEEGNHAVDHAHAGRTAGVFFRYLSKIKWTRGTGGYTMYDTEYNEDEMGNRRGAELGNIWGPLGEEQKIRDFQSRGFSKTQATSMVKGRRR